MKVDPDYETDAVLAAVEEALREGFAFDARAFGQPVALSEVIIDDSKRGGSDRRRCGQALPHGNALEVATKAFGGSPVMSASGDVPGRGIADP